MWLDLTLASGLASVDAKKIFGNKKYRKKGKERKDLTLASGLPPSVDAKKTFGKKKMMKKRRSRLESIETFWGSREKPPTAPKLPRPNNFIRWHDLQLCRQRSEN